MRKDRDLRLWLAVLACLAALAILYGPSLVASATTRHRALQQTEDDEKKVSCGKYEMDRQYDPEFQRPAGCPVM